MHPNYYHPPDALRTALRKTARQLLSKLLRPTGKSPNYIVVNNALVSATTLDVIANGSTTCPHCKVHSALESQHGSGESIPEPTTAPKAFYVDVTLLIPTSMVNPKLLVVDVVTAESIAALLD